MCVWNFVGLVCHKSSVHFFFLLPLFVLTIQSYTGIKSILGRHRCTNLQKHGTISLQCSSMWSCKDFEYLTVYSTSSKTLKNQENSFAARHQAKTNRSLWLSGHWVALHCKQLWFCHSHTVRHQEHFLKSLFVNTVHHDVLKCKLKLCGTKKKPNVNMIVI